MIKKKIKVVKNHEYLNYFMYITKEDLKILNLTDKTKNINMSNYKNHDEDLDVILLSIKEYNKLNNVFIGCESNNILQLFNIIIDNLEEELEISKNKNKKLEIKIDNKELTKEEVLLLINNYNLSSKINN
jgi:hypothetical protein